MRVEIIKDEAFSLLKDHWVIDMRALKMKQAEKVEIFFKDNGMFWGSGKIFKYTEDKNRYVFCRPFTSRGEKNKNCLTHDSRIFNKNSPTTRLVTFEELETFINKQK